MHFCLVHRKKDVEALERMRRRFFSGYHDRRVRARRRCWTSMDSFLWSIRREGGYIHIYMIEAYKIMRVRDRVESQDLFSQGGNVKD